MNKTITFLAVCLVLLVAGCDQIGELSSKAIEQRVQQETDKLAEKAFGSIDKSLGLVGSRLPKSGSNPNIIADRTLQVAGITPTSSTIKETPGRVVAIYCTFEKALEASLEARFLNEAGAEIGRAKQQVTVKAGAAQFIEFDIDPRSNINEIRSINLRRT